MPQVQMAELRDNDQMGLDKKAGDSLVGLGCGIALSCFARGLEAELMRSGPQMSEPKITWI